MEHKCQNNKGNGIKVNKQLYEQRTTEHLKHARVLLATGDYVQAGEKIWGALSALVNSKSADFKDVKGVEDKRYYFNRLFNSYNNRAPTLYPKMRGLHFSDSDEIFDNIYGLHKFFYGGAIYSDQQLKKYLPFFIELLENL